MDEEEEGVLVMYDAVLGSETGQSEEDIAVNSSGDKVHSSRGTCERLDCEES